MADPMNIIAIDDVEMLTGLKADPVLASESSIIHTIEQLFSLAETLSEDSAAKEHSEDEIAQLRALVEEAPIVRVVNSLIHQAVSEGASDIHIEPLDKGVRVRMRIDGILHDLMTPPKDTPVSYTHLGRRKSTRRTPARKVSGSSGRRRSLQVK